MPFPVISGGREYDVSNTSDANDFLQATATTTWDDQEVTAINSQVFMGRQVYNATVARNVLAQMEPVIQLLNEPSSVRQLMLSEYIKACLPPISLIQVLAKSAHPQIFAAIPPTEHAKVVQHCCQMFDRLATCPKWTVTGILQEHDLGLLKAILHCYQHTGFFQPSVDGKLMDTLAAFSKSCCAPVMPCPEIARILRNIVLNYRSIMVQQWNSPNEQIYKQLEESGMLAQYVRLVTVPGVDAEAEVENDVVGVRIILNEIYDCKSLIKNKLEKSSPTGQVLNAVISGEDGYRGSRPAAILNMLLALQKKAEGACYNCGKSGEVVRLNTCSSCEDAKYCGTECQRADWKKHKRSCKKPQSTT